MKLQQANEQNVVEEYKNQIRHLVEDYIASFHPQFRIELAAAIPLHLLIQGLKVGCTVLTNFMRLVICVECVLSPVQDAVNLLCLFS